MKGTKGDEAFDHSGSTFESFLEEEGIRGEVAAVAVMRVLAWQLSLDTITRAAKALGKRVTIRISDVRAG